MNKSLVFIRNSSIAQSMSLGLPASDFWNGEVTATYPVQGIVDATHCGVGMVGIGSLERPLVFFGLKTEACEVNASLRAKICHDLTRVA